MSNDPHDHNFDTCDTTNHDYLPYYIHDDLHSNSLPIKPHVVHAVYTIIFLNISSVKFSLRGSLIIRLAREAYSARDAMSRAGTASRLLEIQHPMPLTYFTICIRIYVTLALFVYKKFAVRNRIPLNLSPVVLVGFIKFIPL